jgi:hypothetical protein
VKVLPEKPQEFGEFYTRSSYMVIDYETLYIIAKGEISNEGTIYFSNDEEMKLIEKFKKSKQTIDNIE